MQASVVGNYMKGGGQKSDLPEITFTKLQIFRHYHLQLFFLNAELIDMAD